VGPGRIGPRLDHWRRQFRGEARVKNDTNITDKDIAGQHLVLWGDLASNSLLKRIADRLPIQWDAGQVVVGSAKFAADAHVPVLVYPKSTQPKRYVVLTAASPSASTIT